MTKVATVSRVLVRVKAPDQTVFGGYILGVSKDSHGAPLVMIGFPGNGVPFLRTGAGTKTAEGWTVTPEFLPALESAIEAAKDALPMGMQGAAWFSDDGRYRYTLERWWGPGKRLVFVMLNPSKAGAEKNDATITRCCNFAKRDGYDGIFVVNLFAMVSTTPKALRAEEDPIGPNNDAAIRMAAKHVTEHGRVVFAYGNSVRFRRLPCDTNDAFADRDVKVQEAFLAALAEADVNYPGKFACFGTTTDGFPLHPVRLAKDTRLFLFTPPTRERVKSKLT